MKKSPKKYIAGGLTLCLFFTQVALPYAMETTVWESRRKAQVERDQSAKVASSAQYAQLPVSLPTIGGPLIPGVISRSVSTQGNVVRSKSIRDFLSHIPLGSVQIQDIYEGAQSKEAPVLLLQDVHLNVEAQTNLALTLERLIKDNQVSLVGVEGAFSKFDFSDFRSLSNKTIVRDVSKSFLDARELAAPSYVGITSETEPPLFLGIDDRVHYERNVAAYLESLPLKGKIQDQLLKRKRALAEEKNKYFSPLLKRFDDLNLSYEGGALGLAAYVNGLEKLSEVVRSPLLGMNLKRFIEASTMEKSFDFSQVEDERKIVVERLIPLLSPADIQAFVSHSLAFRSGQLGFGDYFSWLKEVCDQKGVALQKTPQFEKYIRYVLLADQIKSPSLFSELKDFEMKLTTSLIKTPEEKKLLIENRALQLESKLIDFSLTSDEWAEYKTLVYGPWTIDHRPSFSSFEKFYEEADIRSHKMVENLPTQIPGSSVLVVGGFHSILITKLLREQNRPYIVASPKITKVDDNPSGYLSVFSQEKTPLEKLFQGQKLFLSPQGMNVEDPAKHFRLLSVMVGLIKNTRDVTVNMFGKAYTAHLNTLDLKNPESIKVELSLKGRIGLRLYQLFGVYWEIAFQIPVLLVVAGGNFLSFDPHFTLGAGLIMNLAMAILFAKAHRGNRYEKIILGVLGFVLGSFFLGSIPIPNALGYYALLHSTYNALVLFTPLWRWLPLASLLDPKNRRQFPEFVEESKNRLLSDSSSAEIKFDAILALQRYRFSGALEALVLGLKKYRQNENLVEALLDGIINIARYGILNETRSKHESIRGALIKGLMKSGIERKEFRMSLVAANEYLLDIYRPEGALPTYSSIQKSILKYFKSEYSNTHPDISLVPQGIAGQLKIKVQFNPTLSNLTDFSRWITSSDFKQGGENRRYRAFTNFEVVQKVEAFAKMVINGFVENKDEEGLAQFVSFVYGNGTPENPGLLGALRNISEPSVRERPIIPVESSTKLHRKQHHLRKDIKISLQSLLDLARGLPMVSRFIPENGNQRFLFLGRGANDLFYSAFTKSIFRGYRETADYVILVSADTFGEYYQKEMVDLYGQVVEKPYREDDSSVPYDDFMQAAQQRLHDQFYWETELEINGTKFKIQPRRAEVRFEGRKKNRIEKIPLMKVGPGGSDQQIGYLQRKLKNEAGAQWTLVEVSVGGNSHSLSKSDLGKVSALFANKEFDFRIKRALALKAVYSHIEKTGALNNLDRSKGLIPQILVVDELALGSWPSLVKFAVEEMTRLDEGDLTDGQWETIISKSSPDKINKYRIRKGALLPGEFKNVRALIREVTNGSTGVDVNMFYGMFRSVGEGNAINPPALRTKDLQEHFQIRDFSEAARWHAAPTSLAQDIPHPYAVDEDRLEGESLPLHGDIPIKMETPEVQLSAYLKSLFIYGFKDKNISVGMTEYFEGEYRRLTLQPLFDLISDKASTPKPIRKGALRTLLDFPYEETLSILESLVVKHVGLKKSLEKIALKIFQDLLFDGIRWKKTLKVKNYLLLYSKHSFIEQEMKSTFESVARAAQKAHKLLEEAKANVVAVGVPSDLYFKLSEAEKELLIEKNIFLTPLFAESDTDQVNTLDEFSKWCGAGHQLVFSSAIDRTPHPVQISHLTYLAILKEVAGLFVVIDIESTLRKESAFIYQEMEKEIKSAAAKGLAGFKFSSEIGNLWKKLFRKLARQAKGVSEFDELTYYLDRGQFSERSVMKTVAPFFFRHKKFFSYSILPVYEKGLLVKNMPVMGLWNIDSQKKLEASGNPLVILELGDVVLPTFHGFSGQQDLMTAATYKNVLFEGAIPIVLNKVNILSQLGEYHSLMEDVWRDGSLGGTWAVSEERLPGNAARINKAFGEILLKQWPNPVEKGEVFIKREYPRFTETLILHELGHIINGFTANEEQPYLMEVWRSPYLWVKLFQVFRNVTDRHSADSQVHMQAEAFLVHDFIPGILKKMKEEGAVSIGGISIDDAIDKDLTVERLEALPLLEESLIREVAGNYLSALSNQRDSFSDEKANGSASFFPDKFEYTQKYAPYESIGVGFLVALGIAGLDWMFGASISREAMLKPIALDNNPIGLLIGLLFVVTVFVLGLVINALFVWLHGVLDFFRNKKFNRDFKKLSRLVFGFHLKSFLISSGVGTFILVVFGFDIFWLAGLIYAVAHTYFHAQAPKEYFLKDFEPKALEFLLNEVAFPYDPESSRVNANENRSNLLKRFIDMNLPPYIGEDQKNSFETKIIGQFKKMVQIPILVRLQPRGTFEVTNFRSPFVGAAKLNWFEKPAPTQYPPSGEGAYLRTEVFVQVGTDGEVDISEFHVLQVKRVDAYREEFKKINTFSVKFNHQKKFGLDRWIKVIKEDKGPNVLVVGQVGNKSFTWVRLNTPPMKSEKKPDIAQTESPHERLEKLDEIKIFPKDETEKILGEIFLLRGGMESWVFNAPFTPFGDNQINTSTMKRFQPMMIHHQGAQYLLSPYYFNFVTKEVAQAANLVIAGGVQDRVRRSDNTIPPAGRYLTLRFHELDEFTFLYEDLLRIEIDGKNYLLHQDLDRKGFVIMEGVGADGISVRKLKEDIPMAVDETIPGLVVTLTNDRLIHIKWDDPTKSRPKVLLHFTDRYRMLAWMVDEKKTSLKQPGAEILWLRAIAMGLTGGKYGRIYDRVAPVLENLLVGGIFSGSLEAWTLFVMLHAVDVVIYGMGRLLSKESSPAPPASIPLPYLNFLLAIVLASFNLSLGFSPLDAPALLSHLLLNFALAYLWSPASLPLKMITNTSNHLQQRVYKKGLAALVPIGSLGLNQFGKANSSDRSTQRGLIVLKGSAMALSSNSLWEMERIRLSAALLKTRSTPCEILVDDETGSLAESVVDELMESNSLTSRPIVKKKAVFEMAAFTIEGLKKDYNPRFMLVPASMLGEEKWEGVFALETFVPLSEAIKNIGHALRLILTAA